MRPTLVQLDQQSVVGSNRVLLAEELFFLSLTHVSIIPQLKREVKEECE
jgi:hypothetical protein